jgi:putative phosphoserine phosphatase/1-acylglycerol-3-phosphate O-acyltransferase
VMASLVRRDIVGIGKRELKNLPIIGPLMGASGVVFIDRSNRQAAIDAMAPVVDTMNKERKSLVLAPEGTRAPTRKLGAFKKGGFHIAIQSRLPIVPVVIHNSGDISPKGDPIFRSGTVHVDVLPAIDTLSWSVETIDQHVALVRNAFARTLGQPELSVQETAELQRSTPDDLKPEVRGQRTKVRNTAEKVMAGSRHDPEQGQKKEAPRPSALDNFLNLDEQEAPVTRH